MSKVRTGKFGIVAWLHLAAAPTFAFMSLLTGIQGGGAADMICAPGQDASPLGGMTLMYLLMSAFHLAPWLKLIAGRAVPDPALPKRAESRLD